MILNIIIRNVTRRRVGFIFKSTLQTNSSRLLPILTRKIENKEKLNKIKCFHVSSPRNALPPLVVLLVRYLAKAGAIITGRIVRKWWTKLTPEEKTRVINNIRSRSSRIAIGGGICIFGIYLFYIGNLVDDPITKRRKFMMLNQKQINQIAEFEYIKHIRMFKSEIIPPNHPGYKRVLRVVNKLLLSNRNLKEVENKIWTVTVIDKPDIMNAFALPHGKIFVFSGMLNLCTNDDQLAVVLAHEIAHSILCHVAESMSKVFFIDFILLVPTFFFWLILPDVWAILSEWVTSNLAKIFIHLPFSRAIEREADYIGLKLAAKSCYDVREAPIFWAKMKVINADAPVEWLSTHPSHEQRQLELQELLPEALFIREINKCPPLKYKFGF